MYPSTDVSTLTLLAIFAMSGMFTISTTTSIYDFTLKDITGKEVHLETYRGKVVLIVNVASECGYTPQYKDLQALYERYKERGFVILGFPSNDFGRQEPGTEQEIAAFCKTNYGVSFDMFSKISVKGEGQHPLYKFLTSYEGVAGNVKWNFTKYLVDRNGRPIRKFSSSVKPLSMEVVESVELALGIAEPPR